MCHVFEVNGNGLAKPSRGVDQIKALSFWITSIFELVFYSEKDFGCFPDPSIVRGEGLIR